MGFWDYLTEAGVHPWISGIAAECVTAIRPLDSTVLDRVEGAFEEYVGGDLTPAVLVAVLRSQGYDPEERGDGVWEETRDGRTVAVAFGDAGLSKDDYYRAIRFREENISVRDGVETYPYFAVGMATRLDPRRYGEARQKRIEYHWPDFSIPGR